MPDHLVQPGDCLSSLAKQFGLASWKSIYDHPRNATFRQRNPNANVIKPGDRLFIPDRQGRHEQASTERRHRFKLNAKPTVLRIALKNHEGHALKRMKYQLTISAPSGPIIDVSSTTGDDGLIEHRISPLADSGTLIVHTDPEDEAITTTFDLALGHLDPIDTDSGIQTRLANLGFYAGPVNGTMDAETAAALTRFQEAVELPTDGNDGKCDQTTRDRLQKEHERF